MEKVEEKESQCEEAGKRYGERMGALEASKKPIESVQWLWSFPSLKCPSPTGYPRTHLTSALQMPPPFCHGATAVVVAI